MVVTKPCNWNSMVMAALCFGEVEEREMKWMKLEKINIGRDKRMK